MKAEMKKKKKKYNMAQPSAWNFKNLMNAV